MQQYHLTLKSNNAKTGPIPVSTTSSDSCPPTCPHYETTCYAGLGPLALHWAEVDAGNRGGNLEEFCEQIANLPAGQLWRHNQAGDLPGHGGQIDRPALQQIVEANQGRKGFTYSHKPWTRENLQAVRDANNAGFTVNVSCDGLLQADAARAMGLPTVVVVPTTVSKNFKTPAGNQVTICPAQTRDNVTCATCQLCSRRDRKSIVGFIAHGTRAKLVQFQEEK